MSRTEPVQHVGLGLALQRGKHGGETCIDGIVGKVIGQTQRTYTVLAVAILHGLLQHGKRGGSLYTGRDLQACRTYVHLGRGLHQFLCGLQRGGGIRLRQLGQQRDIRRIGVSRLEGVVYGLGCRAQRLHRLGRAARGKRAVDLHHLGFLAALGGPHEKDILGALNVLIRGDMRQTRTAQAVGVLLLHQRQHRLLRPGQGGKRTRGEVALVLVAQQGGEVSGILGRGAALQHGQQESLVGLVAALVGGIAQTRAHGIAQGLVTLGGDIPSHTV